MSASSLAWGTPLADADVPPQRRPYPALVMIETPESMGLRRERSFDVKKLGRVVALSFAVAVLGALAFWLRALVR